MVLRENKITEDRIMKNISGEKLELVLEDVLGRITDLPISVAVLGSEISININGVLYNFVVDQRREVQL